MTEATKTTVTLFLLSGIMMLLSACTPESASEGTAVAELEFSGLDLNQTNRGTININGYDRHFSVTFPAAYDNAETYPVVLFFHGCRCRPDFSDAAILSYLDWSPRLDPYREDFIIIRMSAWSEKKPEVPQEVAGGGARGMWFWHEGFESERDDYAFVDSLLDALLASSDINIDPENIFGVGHSSGAIFLMSYVLGGPIDLSNVRINDTYSFRAISVTGGSTLRKGIVDFKANTPDILPSVLHIQGERDPGLWFNGQETGKSEINFLEFASVENGSTISDGLRDTIHGLTYSAWDENSPSDPSTLGKWAEHLNLAYSGFEDYSQYYVYNFAPVTTSENVLVGLRVKDCGHRVSADQYQADFFRIFTQQDGNPLEFDNVISRDTALSFC